MSHQHPTPPTTHRGPLTALLGLLLALAVAAGMTPVLAAPAHAASYGTAMVKTQRMSGPSLHDHTLLGWYAKGKRLTLSCHARGQSVKGYYSPWLPNGGWDNLWYRTSDGGWVADVDLNTGSNTPVVGACSTASSFKLPFPAGARVKITQGPGGSFSHTDGYNRHAVDFGVASGTRIVSSGSGTVHFEGWTTGGGGIQVLVRHSNGLCTQYAHLSRTVVDRGQSVKRGQTIAYSGTTGGVAPHLHWNMVDCGSHVSKAVVRTAERGTSYPAGKMVTSTNA